MTRLSTRFPCMKTRYLEPPEGLESPPADMPDTVSTRFDDDDVTDLMIEFATYFTVIAANPGGWKRPGETNYIRSEHLTLESARLAAKTRYENDPRKRGMLIYVVQQYTNSPIGSSRVVEGYPEVPNPYSREARRAKRKTNRLQKSLRNMPDPSTLQPSERHFEPTAEELADIKRKLDEMNVVGKGGSKIAFKYRNRSKR